MGRGGTFKLHTMAILFAWKYRDRTDRYFPAIDRPHPRRCRSENWR